MALSFGEFVDSSSPRLVRTARLLLGSAPEAQDLAQETLIVMYRQWNRLRDPQAADAYAQAMRCTTGTVKSQVNKALTSLRGHLEDQDPFKVGRR